MTEPVPGADTVADTAGGMLRTAREQQGLHIAALAASIKVTPRKLDALENNRWDELPDATFARALAQTVCRTLKIDPKPVLDLLPAAGTGKLENVAGNLNTPFRERGSGADHGLAGTALRPMIVAGALVLLAALAVYFVPAGVWTALGSGTDVPAVAPAPELSASEVTPAASQAAAAGDPLASSAAPGAAIASAAASGPGLAASAAASAAAPGLTPVPTSANGIRLKAVQASWVEARDGQGQVLVSRVLATGEDLALEGESPVRLVIGNAAGVEVRFRQQVIDLQTTTRDNVARLQLP
jgi:cytoskeleton protein RodZ